PLGDHQQVRRHALRLAGVQGTAATHSAHHFIQDEQDAVAVAYLAHAPEVAGNGREHAGGRAADGLGHERDDLVRPDTANGVVEPLRETLAILLRALPWCPVPIRVAWRHVIDVDQQWRELGPAPGVATDREGAERIAVIALAAGDEAA